MTELRCPLLDICVNYCQQVGKGIERNPKSWGACRTMCLLSFRDICAETYIDGKVRPSCAEWLTQLIHAPNEVKNIHVPSATTEEGDLSQRPAAAKKLHCEQTAAVIAEFANRMGLPKSYKFIATGKLGEDLSCEIAVQTSRD